MQIIASHVFCKCFKHLECVIKILREGTEGNHSSEYLLLSAHFWIMNFLLIVACFVILCLLTSRGLEQLLYQSVKAVLCSTQ